MKLTQFKMTTRVAIFTLVITLFEFTQVSDGSYVGCYRETRRPRTYASSPGNYIPAQLDVMKCRVECAFWKYDYAALTQGMFCFCGKADPDTVLNKESDAFCTDICPGNSQPECGGIGHVAVYRTALPIKGLQVKAAGISELKVARLLEPVSFEVGILSGPSDIMYSMDYGSGNTPNNATAMMTNRFTVAGEQKVTVRASDSVGATAEVVSSTVVLVQAAASDVVVNCPEVVTVGQEFSCNASVRVGSFMTASVTFGDGYNEVIPIPDPIWLTAGTGVPQHGEQAGVTIGDNAYMSREMDFPKGGILHAVEAYANGTGSATFMVLSPCSGSAYCADTNTCGACSPSPSCSASDEVYCGAYRECVHNVTLQGTCSSPTRTPPAAAYQVKETFVVSLSNTGWNFVEVGDRGIEVSAGDILGVHVSSSDATLGTRPTEAGEIPDDILGTVPVPSTSMAVAPTSPPVKVLARAHATKPTWLRVFHKYTSPNDYPVTVTVNNDFIDNSTSNFTVLSAQIGINYTEIQCPSYFKTGAVFICTLAPHTGANVTYSWNFTHLVTGISTTQDTTIPTFSGSLSPKGGYSITVRAVNKMDDKSNSSAIIIQDEVTGLSVSANDARVNANHTFTVGLTGGSDYSCDWNMGDTTTYTTSQVITIIGTSYWFHNYTYETDNIVTVNCSNQVSSASKTLVVRSRYPITNLRFDKTGAISTAPSFTIQWFVDQGSVALVNWSLTFQGDNTVIAQSWDQTSKTGASNVVPIKSSGSYYVTLTGSNPVSTETIDMNFTIDTPIMNLKVSHDDPDLEILRDEVITWSVEMTAGSSVELEFDWNDGSSPNLYSVGNLVEWPGTTYIQAHPFNTPGEFNVSVTVKNNFDLYPFFFLVAVLAPIENITLISDAPVPYVDKKGTVQFRIPSSGVPPAGALVAFSYGDGSFESKLAYNPNTLYPHVFNEAKTYTVTANVSNAIDFLVLTLEVTIVVPVSNLLLRVTPAHAPVGDVVTVGVYMDQGNDVTLFWNFDYNDIADTGFDVIKPRKGKTAYDLDNANHTYSMVKNYTIQVIASNVLGNTTLYYLITVQHGVPRAFSILSSSPQTFPPGVTSLSLDINPAATPPTDAMILITWADGSVEGPIMYDPTMPYNWTHVYSSDGHYQTNVTIYNLASSQTFFITTGVYAAITGLSAVAKYQPALPHGGPDQLGLGVNKDTFPAHREVKFHFSQTTGTVVTYMVEAVHQDALAIQMCNHSQSPANIKFLVAGKYDVSVTALSPLYNDSTSLTVTIARAVAGIAIRDYGVSRVNTDKVFTISFEDVGPDSCIVLDWGDTFDKELYSNDTACQTKHGFTTIAGIVTNPMNVTKKFKKGKYELKVSGYSDFGNDEEVISYVVSNIDCNLPFISILDRAEIFYKPRVVYKKETFSIIGYTKLNCAATLDNIKQWTIEKMDETMNIPEKTIDVSVLETSNNVEISVPARFLDFGLYRFTLTVAMDRKKLKQDFESSLWTYVQIVKSPLIGLMTSGGMSVVSMGWSVNMTLSPGTNSRDPDLDHDVDQGFDYYQWFCRQIDEDYPTYANGSLRTDNPSTPKTLANIDSFPSNGGCFRDGPGAIDLAKGELTFNTVNMYENETYEFMVIIFKDSRNATATMRVEILPGNPPSVAINCLDKLCTATSGGLSISPTNRLALKGTCLSNCGPDVILEWSLDRAGLNGAWLAIQPLTKYITGENSPYVAISQQLFADGFELWDQLDTYRVRLSARHPGGKEGVAYTVLNLNTAPSGGNCSISPSVGYVLRDTWNVNCSGWFDKDGISQYLFYAKFKDDDVEKQLAFGRDKMISVDLPLGPAYNNYMMDVYAKISDSRDSSTTFHMGSVQVKPLSKDDLDAEMRKLLTGDQNEVAKAAAEADLDGASKVFTRAAAGLNAQRNYRREGTFGLQTSAWMISTGYGPQAEYQTSISVSDTYNGTLTEDERRAEYQKERNSRSEVRELMATTIAKITKSNVPAVKLAASTFNYITEAIEEVTLVSQKAVAASLVDMSNTLDKLAQEAPKEDLLIAATDMMAAAGQIWEGTLHSVKDGLEKDKQRAMKTKYYKYDTDWESVRENLDTLDARTDGIDGLQTETGSIVQQVENPGITNNLKSTVNKLGDILLNRTVQGEDDMVITTPKLTMTLAKNLASKILNQKRAEGRGSFTMPPWCQLKPKPYTTCSAAETLSLKSSATPMNPNNHAKKDKVGNISSSISISLYDENASEYKISNVDEDIILHIPRDGRFGVPEPIMVEALIPARETDQLFYHSFNVTKEQTSLHIEIKPVEPNIQILVVIRYKEAPIYNKTHKLWDFMQTVPSSMNPADWVNGVDPYTAFLDNIAIANRTGKWYIGVRQLNTSEHDQYDNGVTPGAPAPLTGRFTTNYTLRIYTSGCYYYDEKLQDYMDNGCKVLPTTNHSVQVCGCNHLTTFASGMVVEPNKIDFAYVFSNMDFLKNPTLYITEMLIAVVYIIFAIWARRKDNKDILKLGVSPLPDNDAADRYLYEVVVETGLRKNAGTDSQVYFVLSGEQDETDTRQFGDSQRKILRRGAKDSFLLAVPGCLGPLNYMRIWHDNSGKGKFQGWYLNHVMIHDIQTKEKWVFIANEWFAVEESDGLIDRLLPVAGPEQMTETAHLFGQKASRNLSDDHLWFSVIARPPESRFTRLQRVSCCLVLLFSSMLANAMFYEKTADGAGQSSLEFGPFSLTPQQIYVGVICNLVVFPINFLLVFIFRKSRPRRVRRSRIQEALERSKREYEKTEQSRSHSDNDPIYEEPIESYTQPLKPDAHNVNTGRPMTAMDINLDEKPKKKKKTFSFPWWMTYVAWILLWLVVLTCAAFVTFYGVQFGDSKCKKWITSLVISFFTSIFLTQPIKVFLLALIFSMVFKRTDDDDEGMNDEEDLALSSDEIWLHPPPSYVPKERKIGYKPPDPHALEKARYNRMKELQMYDVLREVIFYAFFLWVLMVVSYGFRDPNAFFLKKNLHFHFVDAGLGDSPYSNAHTDLAQVRTMDQFFNWTKNTLVSSIRAENWYNGMPPIGQRGFIADRTSRMMGWAIMRQLRVKPGLCNTVAKMTPLVPECNVPYSMTDEDDHKYHGSHWRKLYAGVNGTYNETAKDHFIYRTSKELDGWPYWALHGLYSGGGFVVELRGNTDSMLDKIAELETDGWIDRYTRAVFVEFTTYNAQVNLFAVTTLAVEFMKSGGISVYTRIQPVNLLGFYSSAMLFQLACQIIYLAFIAFFIVKEIRKLVKLRFKTYFKEPWNWVELFIISLSLAAVAIYFYRLQQTKILTKKFADTHGNAYMRFQYVAYWNELLIFLVGWTVFFATVKFIRLLRFNKRMSLLGQTLRYAAHGMMMFGMIFGIVFMAYCQFFYMIYFNDLYNFSTIIYTMETCLQMLVGKFNFNAMQFVSPVLGPATFFCYVVTVYYILINMFLTILNEAFAKVRAEVDEQCNEHELVSFMVERFKQWTGFGNLLGGDKKPVEEMKHDIGGDRRNGEQIDNFQDRIELLLDSLSKAYHDQEAFESLFYDGGKGGKSKKDDDGTGATYARPRGKSGMAALRRRPPSMSNDEAAPSSSAGHLPGVE